MRTANNYQQIRPQNNHKDHPPNKKGTDSAMERVQTLFPFTLNIGGPPPTNIGIGDTQSIDDKTNDGG